MDPKKCLKNNFQNLHPIMPPKNGQGNDAKNVPENAPKTSALKKGPQNN